MLQHGKRILNYKREGLSLPVGYVLNPLADIQINAGYLGWDNPHDYWKTENGGLDDTGHGDFIYEPYSDTWMWWQGVGGPFGIRTGRQI